MDQREKELLKIFRALHSTQQQGVLDYAAFLLERSELQEPSQPVPAEPLPIPRPVDESVVAAMKRLRATYPMVNTGALLNEASSLMAQHLMQGRDRSDVIDRLEQLFAEQFTAMAEKQ